MLAQILWARENDKIFLGVLVLEYFVLLVLRGDYIWFEGLYDPRQLYLFSLGALDLANDENFASLKRSYGIEVASNIVFRRIFVSNIVFLYSTANAVFFLPTYVNWMKGKLFSKTDLRLHIIGYLGFFIFGFLVFWHLYLSTDYYFIYPSAPDEPPAIEDWWHLYCLGQAVTMYWFGMVFSIVVILAKSLISQRVVEEDDANS